EFKRKLKEARSAHVSVRKVLAREWGAELHPCGARETGLVFEGEWGRLAARLQLPDYGLFSYMLSGRSADGLRWCNVGFLETLGIGCSTWDVVAAEDCRAKMVECSKF